MGMRQTPLWFKGLITLILCGLVFSFVQLQKETGQQQVVENFFLALRNKQRTKAYYANTSESFQQTMSLGAFKDYLEQHPLLESDLQLHLIIDESNVRVAFDNQLNASIDLTKEDDVWKIASIKILGE